MSGYSVRLSPAAARVYEKLAPDVRARLRDALIDLAGRLVEPERIPGKSVKTIRGQSDSFHRLRVGDYRVMYDVIEEDRVVLVLGVFHRRDLEAWLRNR